MANAPKILVVDDIPRNRRILRDRLESRGCAVLEAGDGEEALVMVQREMPDVVFLDIIMPGMDGYAVLENLKADDELRHIPVIVVSAVDQIQSVARCLELGAEDYLSKPFNAAVLEARLGSSLQKKSWQDQERSYRSQIEEANRSLERRVNERTEELQSALKEVETLKNKLVAENTYLQQEVTLGHDFGDIVTESKEFREVLDTVEQVASTNATVLILGETGTGKEVIARAIHSISDRKDRPLVKVNCASLPASLIESELFGHEKGSFTGANTRRIGRFELADGGTLFLDEIAELPTDLQPKLLRVLQEGEFERLGGSHTISIDVRVMAATNRDLAKEIAHGTFREDLYYRLNVFPIRCPPLRERISDIPLLAQHFLKIFAAKTGKTITGIPDQVMAALTAYGWPGNVRELENIIERAVIISRGTDLELGDWFHTAEASSSAGAIETLEEHERRYITKILKRSGWKVRGANGAAAVLDIKPTTLEARMVKLGIERPLAAT
jgi:formate hydrogenlyase transcriptional activator